MLVTRLPQTTPVSGSIRGLAAVVENFSRTAFTHPDINLGVAELLCVDFKFCVVIKKYSTRERHDWGGPNDGPVLYTN